MLENALLAQLEAAQRRLDRLRQRADVLLSEGTKEGELMAEALEELSISLGELNATTEELVERNTQLQAAHEVIQKERRRYQELFELAPDGYLVTDRGGIIQEANQAAAVLLNRKQPFLPGKPLINFVVAEDRDLLRRKLDCLRGKQGICKLELRLLPTRMTEPLTMAVTVAASTGANEQPDTLRWLLRDITEHQRMEMALRTSEAELRLLTAQMPSIVWTTDDQLCLQQVIGAGLGSRDRNLLASYVGKNLFELLETKAVEPSGIAAHQQALHGRTASYEFQLEQRDFHACVESLRDTEGRISGCIGVALDITASKHIIEKLRRLQTELAHVDRLNTLGGMATGLAHELNQPLTAIVSYGQTSLYLLQSGAVQLKDLGEALEEIVAQGKRAGEIIRRMRKLVRTRKAGHRERVAINALIAEVAAFIDWQARKQMVSIRQELATGLPPIVVDIIQIQQVLLNLLNNALEALEGCEQREIIIRTAKRQDNTIEVAVTDTGRGIPNDAFRSVFEPFYTTKENGIGMGLEINRMIVEAHGGRLWATPNPQQGVTFRFTLLIDTHMGATQSEEGAYDWP